MSSGSDTYIGMMSGTSLDGVDIAIVNFAATPPVVIHCHTEPYPAELVQRIRHITRLGSVGIDDLCQLDIEIARFYAAVVNQALVTASISPDKINAIGCHGQTIRHRPDLTPAYTLQIGDPNTLSAITGLNTIADFRRRDMALGGQGAPLAPAFHQFMFRTGDCNRAIINIGGIANLTLLPADSSMPVIGFDTGPGNTMLDYWIQKHQHKNYDGNGDWAASGQVIDELLQSMLTSEQFFTQKLPKSTGTEYFSPAWLTTFSLHNFEPADVQATLLELSANTITKGIHQLDVVIEECYVCGGGAHNKQLMHRLQALLPCVNVSSTANLGISPDYVEALAFAWLARQTVNGQAGNLPSVTSASSSTVLGGIFQSNRSGA